MQADVVKLPLRRKVYINYLRTIFECGEGPVCISRNHDIGKLVTSLRCYSDTPVHPEWASDYELLDVILPQSDYSKKNRHFVYWTREFTEMINDTIEVYLNTYFGTFMFMSSQLGIQQKDALAGFQAGLNADDDDQLFDRFKKRHYRFRLSVHEFLDSSLRLAGLRIPKRILKRRSKHRISL
jgi:hypothetical protein